MKSSGILAKIYPLLIIILQNISRTYSYRILGVFPHPGLSHFHVFHPIMRGLAEVGHNVTVVSYFADQNPVANYTDYEIVGLKKMVDFFDLREFGKTTFYQHFVEFFMLYNWGAKSCEALLKSDGIDKILSNPEPYDLIIMEQFNSDCALGLSYILNIPTVALSSCAIMPWHYKRFGNIFLPSIIPTNFLGLSENMGFFDRVQNFLTFNILDFLYTHFSQRTTNKLLRERFGVNIPDIELLAKNTNLLLVNEHHSLSAVKALSPAVIEIGGVHIKEPKPLSHDIQTILDTSEHGVIYISWGSLIRGDTLPDEKREAFLKALSRLKQVVLWKWENETMPNQPQNVHLRKWMSQKDILCHGNVKVFMSHGGLLGASEAAYCGVPIVGTPFYGDQFLNIAALVNRNMGVILNYNHITEDTVYNALIEALKPKYAENAKIVSTAYKSRPMKPLDTAIWWVEHVIKTGGSPLSKSISANLPWYTIYSIDVFGFLIISALLFCIIWIYIIKKCLSKKNISDNKTKVN